jgi:D-alanine---D-serine ligase
MKPVIGVIFGGKSSEYSISLHSTASFLRSIHADKYDLVLIGIDEDGKFYVYSGSIDDLEHDHWAAQAVPAAWVRQGILPLDGSEAIKLDGAFPVLHGKNGEDGSIQGLLELMGIPYVGCDLLGSALCMDKELMHVVCDQAGIPAADYVCLKEGEENPSFEQLKEIIPLPWVVKPCNAGSSYGVHFVEDKEQFENAVKDAWYYDGRHKALVEKAVDGFEIGCAVMEEDGKLITGSIDEIETAGKVFDFEGKYDLKESAIYCPARIDEKQTEQAKELAKKVFKALNCSGMARVDMFVCKDGSIILNEVNTIPGFTATSRYPSMMKDAGIDFGTLIDRLIAQGLKKTVDAR